MLLNGKAMSKTSPDFVIPGPDRLALIRAGWVVKVESNSERFWVRVTSTLGDLITGRVDNVLIYPTNCARWPYGSAIELSREHVLDAQGPLDREAFYRAAGGRVDRGLVIRAESVRLQPCGGGEELLQKYLAHQPSSQQTHTPRLLLRWALPFALAFYLHACTQRVRPWQRLGRYNPRIG